jgi:oligosaccharide repeat unit polymerase
MPHILRRRATFSLSHSFPLSSDAFKFSTHVKSSPPARVTSRPRSSQLVGLILCAAAVATIVLSDHAHVVSLIAISFMANLVASAVLVIVEASAGRVTLALVHVLGVWFMMVLAPFAAFLNGNFSSLDFYHTQFTDERVFLANSLVLLWVAIFTAVYHWAPTRAPCPRPSTSIESKGLWLQIGCGALSLWFLYERVGLGLLTRKAFEEAIEAESISQYILLSVPLRLVSVFAIAAALLMLRSARLSRLNRLCAIVAVGALTGATAAINNPLAAPRYYLASVVLGFAFILWLGRERKATHFVVLTCVAIYGVFPTDFGRSSVSVDEAIESIRYSSQISVAQDNFRTYETLVASLEYWEKNGSVHGRQLFGNFLFWIPREIWPEKPVGTGTFLAEEFGEGFTNIACPAQCEAVVNFGLIGVPVLALVLALVLRKLDRWYWNGARDERGVVPISNVLYPFLLGNVFFLTRGDLLSPLAYSVVMLVGIVPLLASHWAVKSAERIARALR